MVKKSTAKLTYESNPKETDVLNLSVAESELASEIAQYLTMTLNWSKSMGWMHYNREKLVWEDATDETALRIVGEYLDDIRFKRTNLFNSYALANPSDDRWVKKIMALSVLQKKVVRSNVTALVKTLVEVPKDFPWDSHNDWLHTPSGPVDLKTGKIYPASALHYFTRVTPVGYYAEAWNGGKHKEDKWKYARNDWLKCLEALKPDARQFFQSRIGQALSGYMQEDGEMMICTGFGSNGKTVAFAAISAAVGNVAKIMPPELMTGGPSAHPTERTELHGTRLALIEETAEGRHLNVNAMKQFVDSPTISARKMGRDFYTFANQSSIFITTNNVPDVTEADLATWRRLILVLFPYTYVKKGEPLLDANHRQGDPGLKRRMLEQKENREVVLSWIVEGAVNYYAGMNTDKPASVELDTNAWKGEADLLGNYMDNYLEFAPGYMTPLKDLYDDFCRVNGRKPRDQWGQKTFNIRWAEHPRLQGGIVTKTQTRDLDKITRRPDRGFGDYVEPITATQPEVVKGVRIVPNPILVPVGI